MLDKPPWACPPTLQVNLNFHFDVEQTARSYMGWFFNFNGTAGVWRIRTIHDAGE